MTPPLPTPTRLPGKRVMIVLFLLGFLGVLAAVAISENRRQQSEAPRTDRSALGVVAPAPGTPPEPAAPAP